MIENTEKLNNQAINLASQGNFEEAIACFKRAITMEKQNYLLWFNLGLTYRDAGNYDQAKYAIEQAFYLNPNDEEILETLSSMCFFSGDFDEAMYYCSMGLHLNVANAHLWNTVGIINFNENNYEDAAEAFEHAVSINPYYYDALYNLHDTYEELGNKTGVEECKIRLSQIKKS